MARIIAITQHTIEMVWIVDIFCNHAGKYPKYILILSSPLNPETFNPIDDHIINKIKAGNKKIIAKAAVVFRETLDFVVIAIDL